MGWGWLERKKQKKGARDFVMVLSYWTFSPRIGDVGGWISLWGRTSPRESPSCCGRELKPEPKRLAEGLEHKLMVLHMNFVEMKAWRTWGLG